jgi:uncharacterized protein YkwD
MRLSSSRRRIAIVTLMPGVVVMLAGVASAEVILGNKHDAVTSRESQPLEIAPVERELIELINAERQRDGKAALAIDARLMDAAAAHSIDMAGSGVFAHQGSGSSGPEERVQDAGYRWRYIAENIGCGQDSPERIVASWMQSTGHRENLLSVEARDIGVGLATRKDSRCGIFWTAVFADEQRE